VAFKFRTAWFLKIFFIGRYFKINDITKKSDTVEFNGDLPEAYKVNRNYLFLQGDPHGGKDVVKYMTRQTQRRK